MRRWVSNRRTSATVGSGWSPGAAGIEEPANRLHRRHAAANHVGERRLTGKDRILVRQEHPLVREASGMQDLQRLEDADEIRDAGEPIGVEHAIELAFHLVEGPVADAA